MNTREFIETVQVLTPEEVEIVCTHFVAICGAHHPFLFDLAKKKIVVSAYTYYC